MPLSLRRQRWSPLNVPPHVECSRAGSVHTGVRVVGAVSRRRNSSERGRACGVVVIARCDNCQRGGGVRGSQRADQDITSPREHKNRSCREDARVALSEAVYVLVTLHLGRVSGIPPMSRHVGPEVRRQARPAVPTQVPSDSWLELDQWI